MYMHMTLYTNLQLFPLGIPVRTELEQLLENPRVLDHSLNWLQEVAGQVHFVLEFGLPRL